MNLADILKQYHSIRLNQSAASWEEAIQKSTEPLVEAGTVTGDYADEIIAATKQFGSYYILAPWMAMPHGMPGKNVLADSFSLVTLKTPVIFPDGSEVKILACLAAAHKENSLTDAIAQIAILFSTDTIIEKIEKCQSEADIVELITSICS